MKLANPLAKPVRADTSAQLLIKKCIVQLAQSAIRQSQKEHHVPDAVLVCTQMNPVSRLAKNVPMATFVPTQTDRRFLVQQVRPVWVMSLKETCVSNALLDFTMNCRDK